MTFTTMTTLLTAAAGALALAGPATASPSRETCWMSLSHAPTHTAFAAHAAPGASGSYELVLRRRGPGGLTDVEQSGPFAADPQAPVRLSSLTIASRSVAAGPRRANGLVRSRPGFAEPGPIVDPGRLGLSGRLRVYDRRGRLICDTTEFRVHHAN